MKPWQRRAPWIAAGGVVGAFAFVLAQRLEGFNTHIAEFMGAQIVQRGGYSTSLAVPIGWGVHLGVALTYACFFGVLTLLPVFPTARGPRWGAAAGMVLILGWLTTLVTAPAIQITIGLLSGQGFPNTLPGLNTSFGAPFWNHMLFFAICAVLIVVVPDIVGQRTKPR